MCTLNLGCIFAQWFPVSVLPSLAIRSLPGIPHEINASREPSVHLLSLAIRSSIHAFLLKNRILSACYGLGMVLGPGVRWPINRHLVAIMKLIF